MNRRQEYLEPVTPVASNSNVSFWRAEDSGYHTSYTPSSLDYSETSNENLEPARSKNCNSFQLTGNNVTNKRSRKHRLCKSTPIASQTLSSFFESPLRRGIKRAYPEDNEQFECSFTSLQTPTSVIAGGIQKLRVDDGKTSPLHPQNETTIVLNYSTVSYPTTPKKRMCRSSAKTTSSECIISPLTSPLRSINNIRCPPRRSAKKLNLALNSLPGETEPITKPRHSKVVRTIFTPDRKVDIVEGLLKKNFCMPAIEKIFSFLTNEDIYNFSLVSPTWLQVCEIVNNAKQKKEEYVQFIITTKENYANRKSEHIERTPIIVERNVKEPGSSLKDINNVINIQSKKSSPKRSPPATPRTKRFRKFTKSASLDSRVQLSCVRCQQPAKVNDDSSGEVWVECTSKVCLYQFCKLCKSDRHPGKVCHRYDLSAPSPSKRRSSECAIGTKKSKRNLRRLF